MTLADASSSALVREGIARQAEAAARLTADLRTADLVVCALDVDGSLSPITDDAQNTVFAEGVPAALRALDALPNVLLVLNSGRSAEYLWAMEQRQGVADLRIPILGTYGRVSLLRGPGGSMVWDEHPAVPFCNARLERFLPVFERTLRRVMQADVTFSQDPLSPGSVVFERKPAMLTYHYGFGLGSRAAFEEALSAPLVVATMQRLELHASPASGAVEIDALAVGATDKGTALRRFVLDAIAARGEAARRVVVIGAGDDKGDRPAKAAVAALTAEGTASASYWCTVFSPPAGRREGTPADLCHGAVVFGSPSDLGLWLRDTARAAGEHGLGRPVQDRVPGARPEPTRHHRTDRPASTPRGQ